MVSWHKLVVGLSDPLLLSEFKGWFLFLTTDAANHHHGVWNSSRVQSLSYVIASNKDSTAGALLTVDNDAWSTLPSNSCVGFTGLAEVGLCSCQRGEQIWLRCMESCSVWAIFFFFQSLFADQKYHYLHTLKCHLLRLCNALVKGGVT